MLSLVQLFAIPWTVAHQDPLSRGSPGTNTGMGCHSLLRGIFSTQGLNLGLPHCRQILYHLSHRSRFRFTEKLSRKSGVPAKPCPATATPATNIRYHRGTDVCFNRWAYTNTALSPEVHSLHDSSLLVLCILWCGQISNDMHPTLQNHTSLSLVSALISNPFLTP